MGNPYRVPMDVIIDLQFGSTGKGLLAGHLAQVHAPDTVVAAWGPNAGHTFMFNNMDKMVNIALPNGIVSEGLKRVMIGPGSVINPELLLSELERYDAWMDGIDLCIHENAAVVLERHREAEAKYGFRIGSTMKGVGEAVIEKIRRYTYAPWEEPNGARLINTAGEQFDLDHPLGKCVVNHREYIRKLAMADRVLVEGAQGYSLGINSGMYPYVTSRECTVNQVLLDCGVPMGAGWEIKVHGVARTFPIRVANRFGPCGCTTEPGAGGRPFNACVQCEGTGKIQIGTSGPCYPDQRELRWEDINQEPELTTVTRLPRRIFTFSEEQIRQACLMSAVDDVFLNFCNYCPDEGAAVRRVIEKYAPVRWLGFGPMVGNIKEAWHGQRARIAEENRVDNPAPSRRAGHRRSPANHPYL